MSNIASIFGGSFGITISAQCLSQNIAEALRTKLKHVGVKDEDLPKLFMDICATTTQAFRETNRDITPSDTFQEFRQKVTLPFDLASLCFSHLKNMKKFFEPANDEPIAISTIGEEFIPQDDLIPLISLEDIFSEAHAAAEKADQEEWAENNRKIETEEAHFELSFPVEENVVSIAETNGEFLPEPLGMPTQESIFSDQEIDELLPSLESHLSQAHEQAEKEVVADLEARLQAVMAPPISKTDPIAAILSVLPWQQIPAQPST